MSSFNHSADKVSEACGISEDRWSVLAAEAGEILSENEGCISKVLEGISNIEATDVEKIAMAFMVGGFITDQMSAIKHVNGLMKKIMKKI